MLNNDTMQAEVQAMLAQVDALDRKPRHQSPEWIAEMILQRAELRELLRRLAAYLLGFATTAAVHRELLSQLRSFTQEHLKADGTSHLGLLPGFAPRFLALMRKVLEAPIDPPN